jgi:hypothetical protein
MIFLAPFPQSFNAIKKENDNLRDILGTISAKLQCNKKTKGTKNKEWYKGQGLNTITYHGFSKGSI